MVLKKYTFTSPPKSETSQVKISTRRLSKLKNLDSYFFMLICGTMIQRPEAFTW